MSCVLEFEKHSFIKCTLHEIHICEITQEIQLEGTWRYLIHSFSGTNTPNLSSSGH